MLSASERQIVFTVAQRQLREDLMAIRYRRTLELLEAAVRVGVVAVRREGPDAEAR